MKARLAARGIALVSTEAARAGYSRVFAGSGPVPTRARGLTPEWLEGAMGLPAGAISAVSVLHEDSGTAGRARLRLEAGAGSDAPGTVFVKLTPTAYAQHMIMLLFGLGTREVQVYRGIAADLPVRVPHCYAAVLDERRGRDAIVLEDLSETARFRDIRRARLGRGGRGCHRRDGATARRVLGDASIPWGPAAAHRAIARSQPARGRDP